VEECACISSALQNTMKLAVRQHRARLRETAQSLRELKRLEFVQHDAIAIQHFACSGCTKSYSTFRKLKTHLTRSGHSAEGDLQCLLDAGKRAFSTLAVHLRVSRGNRTSTITNTTSSLCLFLEYLYLVCNVSIAHLTPDVFVTRVQEFDTFVCCRHKVSSRRQVLCACIVALRYYTGSVVGIAELSPDLQQRLGTLPLSHEVPARIQRMGSLLKAYQRKKNAEARSDSGANELRKQQTMFKDMKAASDTAHLQLSFALSLSRWLTPVSRMSPAALHMWPKVVANLFFVELAVPPRPELVRRARVQSLRLRDTAMRADLADGIYMVDGLPAPRYRFISATDKTSETYGPFDCMITGKLAMCVMILIEHVLPSIRAYSQQDGTPYLISKADGSCGYCTSAFSRLISTANSRMTEGCLHAPPALYRTTSVRHYKVRDKQSDAFMDMHARESRHSRAAQQLHYTTADPALRQQALRQARNF
jgi:hypothetical protein